MPRQFNDPSFMQFLADALRQRSMSPDPSGQYVREAPMPPQQAPMQAPDPSMMGDIPLQGVDAIQRQRMERERAMREMGL